MAGNRPFRDGDKSEPMSPVGRKLDCTSFNAPCSAPAFRRDFQKALLRWYDGNKRDLPWRRNRDPYRVWLAEIMLQQTRVAAVIDYYHRFLERFPDTYALAAAPLDSVLATWSGLGYYRRARALHQAAQEIVREHDGKLPCTAKDLATLPGIGRYTAAAIASIAFDEPAAVVDGNVERVLQRTSGKLLTREETWVAAQQLLSPKRPGDFNQAMMEMGATVCTPRQPLCLTCCIRKLCKMRGEFPAAQPGRRQKREISYGLNLSNGSVLLKRRSKRASLMAGMWELPQIKGGNGDGIKYMTLRHSITVTDYLVHVFKNVEECRSGEWFARSMVAELPLTGLTRKILRAAKII
jgi:A/G-specific adenine glycosylase